MTSPGIPSSTRLNEYKLVLLDEIGAFLGDPSPVWNNKLTEILAARRWEEFMKAGIFEKQVDYNTPAIVFKDKKKYPSVQENLINHNGNATWLEQPSIGYLYEFYQEHGLEPSPIDGPSTDTIVRRLKAAFCVLAQIPECLNEVTTLIRAIQVILSEGPDYDASYSHPDIPFSIFVSVCHDAEPVSNLRVAESILHEAMHLKLTLIEEVVPLVKSGDTSTFYSPWRDELRSIRGVLHGLFVFTAIQLFYGRLLIQLDNASGEADFVIKRRREIFAEIHMLDGLENTNGFTLFGKNLTTSLMSAAKH